MASHDDDGKDRGIDLPGRPRRSSPRYDLRREVEIRCRSWDEFLTLYTGNVSRSGVLVHMAEAPAIGEAVTVRVKGPRGTSVAVEGEVARVEGRTGPAGEVGVGIRLAEPQPGALLDLLTQAHGVPAPNPESSWSTEEGRWGSAFEEGSDDIPLVEIDDLLEAGDDGAGEERQEALGAPVRQVGSRRATEMARPAGSPPAAGAPLVGLDFGTTTTKVAVVHEGEVVLIEDESAQAANRAAVPSCVARTAAGEWLVGGRARAMLATEPKRVVSSVKRVMGLEYHDRLAAGLLGSLACPSTPGPNGTILFELGGAQVTVPDVASRIIGHAKGLAEAWLGEPIAGAVLTVPVDFGQRARREIELAAKMAGLEVAAMIPEPVAAAMGCGLDGVAQATVAVYDFGGGTFDASVVQVGGRELRVLGAAGDRWLGGDDFDEALARHVADEFLRSSGVDLHGRAEPWQRLLFASEDAKRWLSTLGEVDVIMPEAALRPEGPVTLLVPVTRSTFDEICAVVVDASIEVFRQALDQAGLGPSEVDAVIVTGGTTRVPAVREAVRRLFDREPIEGIHPEHSVVIGAAVHAAARGKDASRRLRGISRRLRALDDDARAVGIALADGTTEPVIRTSQRPPVAAHRLYSTSRDGQDRVRIEIMSGEATATAENRRVGGFVVGGLPPAPAGSIDLDVYFELSSSGTLCVTAQERSRGQKVRQTFEL